MIGCTQYCTGHRSLSLPGLRIDSRGPRTRMLSRRLSQGPTMNAPMHISSFVPWPTLALADCTYLAKRLALEIPLECGFALLSVPYEWNPQCLASGRFKTLAVEGEYPPASNKPFGRRCMQESPPEAIPLVFDAMKAVWLATKTAHPSSLVSLPRPSAPA